MRLAALMSRRRLVLAVGALVVGVAAPSAVAIPPAAPDLGAGIERYAAYEGQATCDPVQKPGVVAFRDLVLKQYGGSAGGISRACDSGGRSEHKEGRAWDWPVRADRPADVAKVDELLRWLLASDCYGNRHAMARRLGIMYIIWNHKVWESYRPDAGWQPYTGASPHTDHVHFSFSWAGANRSTSYWSFDRVAGGTCLEVVATKVESDAFVTALYTDFLGRRPDESGRHHWSKLVMSGEMSTRQAAFSMATTDEWLRHVVDQMYRDTLGRESDDGGRQFWLGELRKGMTVAQLAARFYASQEYYLRVGGTDAAWVADLYRKLLEREGEPGGLSFWQQRTASVGRVSVAGDFYQSQETLVRRVNALYKHLLGRTADSAGLVTWPPVVRDRGDLELAGFLASSYEYWLRAQDRF